MLQASVVRLEDLVPNSLRNERFREARKASLYAGQFSKCVAEIERLPVSQIVRDLTDVIVRSGGRVSRGKIVVKHSALCRQREEVKEVSTDCRDTGPGKILIESIARNCCARANRLSRIEYLYWTTEELQYIRIGQQFTEIPVAHP